jgi:uncharacterized membrane protein YdjX (TVP38/TMEM64 family)
MRKRTTLQHSGHRRNTRPRWALLAVIVLALILVPFILFEEPLARWAKVLLLPENRSWAAAAVFALLALDVFLPIPSSMVSTASGALLGFGGGMVASAAGMTAGALIGFVLGRMLGPGTAGRLVGEGEVARVSQSWERHGVWVLVLFRAVPVLAEASVIFAGLARMPVGHFLLLTGGANLCISAAYAAAGAYAVTGQTFLLAFAAAVLLPLLATMVAKRQGR